jgi:hypothetical protein
MREVGLPSGTDGPMGKERQAQSACAIAFGRSNWTLSRGHVRVAWAQLQRKVMSNRTGVTEALVELNINRYWK